MNKYLFSCAALALAVFCIPGITQGQPLPVLDAPHAPFGPATALDPNPWGFQNGGNGGKTKADDGSLVGPFSEGNVPGLDYIDGASGAITVYSNSAQDGGDPSGPDQLINGSNMDTDYVNNSDQGNGRGAFHSFGPNRQVGIDFTFDRSYNVTDIWVWNGNQLNHGGSRGIDTMDILVTTDGSNYDLVHNDVSVARAPDPINQAGIPIGPHDYAGAGTNEYSVNRAVVGVRITDITHFADSDGCCDNFSSIRFNIVPEPATLGLLSAGALMLLKRRRSA
jgi:hypothetical protein